MIEREVFYDGLLVETRCSGKVTLEELLNSAHWMLDNYGGVIKPGFSQVFDALEANTDAITIEDMHRVAHININHGAKRVGFSMAILALKPYPQALAKLHKVLSAAANIRVEIFGNYEDAYRWLDIRNPHAASHDEPA